MNFVWKIGRVTLKRTINYTEIAVLEKTICCGIKNKILKIPAINGYT